MNGRLQGEPIVNTSSGGANAWFCATTRHLYRFRREGLIPSLPFEVDTWIGDFTAPSGTTIVDAFYTKDNTRPHGILILLSNGDIYWIQEHFDGNVYTYFSPVYQAHLGSVGSDSWTKIKGDALYALSSSYIDVSRDSSHAIWTPDTAGLPSQFGKPIRIGDFYLDSEQNVYATTAAGLFIQTPTGSTWTKVTSLTGSGSDNLKQIFIDRRDRMIVSNNGSQGIFISVDHGSSWRNDATVATMRGASDDSFGDDFIYGQDAQGNLVLLKSSDGLQTWQSISAGITAQTNASVAITSISGDTILIAGTTAGVYASTDRGTTWTAANRGINAETFHGFAKTSPGFFMASDALGVFSIKAGDTIWSKSYPTSGFSSRTSLYQDGISNVYALDIGLTSALPLFISSDRGASWQADTLGVPMQNANVWYVDEFGTQHLASSAYGSSFRNTIFVKPRGGSWMGDTAGYTPQTHSYANSMSSDWHGMLYLSGVGFPGTVSRRPISGGSWIADTIGLGSGIYFSHMTAGPDGSMFGSTGSDLYHHVSGTWQLIASPPGIQYAYPDAFSVDSNNILFVDWSVTGPGSGIYFTTNVGASWTYAGFGGMKVSGLYSYGDTTYATTSDGIFALVAKPGIAEFTSSVSSVDFGPVAVGQSRDTTILINNNGAIDDTITSITSDNAAFSVIDPPSGIPAFSTTTLTVHFAPVSAGPVSGNLSIASNAAGSPDRIALAGTSGSSGVQSDLVTHSIILGAPYPNPSSGDVTVPIHLGEDGRITILLLDMIGRELATVFDGHLLDGDRQISINLGKITPGAYFLKVRTANEEMVVPILMRK
ncbi:MAG: choice-of-anchor D domain-containing protein [Bacteroidota bacterium]|nr:choice-of-anchor D domain-containing protein [Bacteroidota bacterium]MDP4232093.1 choice-of-anchor D domain-containing protein [Bacteroidota bacterium]MDP4241200.1 choice-of-anchor D domain-containing protein [Bacteroidota bacterium]MDP4286592.1 choice-of-anchor D domain-containing protein [Bacteroidota bacterium]